MEHINETQLNTLVLHLTTNSTGSLK